MTNGDDTQKKQDDTKKKRDDQKKTITSEPGDCPCNEYIPDEITICCEKCQLYWHLRCVALSGLTTAMVLAIECWLCPYCYVNPVPKTASQDSITSTSSCNTIRTMLKTELNLITPVLRAAVKDAVNSTIEKQQERVVEAVGSIVEKVTDKSIKSYADVNKTQKKKILEEVKNVESSKKVVEEVCRKIDNDYIERECRRRNVMVSGVAEIKSSNSRNRREGDTNFLINTLGMEADEIEVCFRAGEVKNDRQGNPVPRPLIVKMKSVDNAEYWHDFGKGFKVDNYWINADLCKADREASFFSRQDRRERRKQEMSPISQ